MKILLFGTGDYYGRLKKWFEDKEVLALVDNSKIKQGSYLDGRAILSPEDALKLDYDTIVILSFYVREIRQQLIKLGVDEKCIYHFYQLHDLLKGRYIERELITYEAIQNDIKSGKRVLLLSHDLNLGGPSLALMNIAVLMKRMGYDVTFVSMIDGPLVSSLLERGIRVVVDENLQLQTMTESKWDSGYDLIVCNTINFYVFLSERNTSIRVLWWLHDSRFFYDGVDLNRLQSMSMTNMKCVSVGPVPRKALREFLPGIEMKDLLYGVEDHYIFNADEVPKGDILSFVTVGFIEKRKGQDILVDAIMDLPKSVLKQCSFSFVGQNTSLLANELMEKTRYIEQIHIVGMVNRDDMNRILAEADVLICPSREDPMPTVVAEAMMHGVPCVISDAIGTVDYITDNVNGIVFKSENVQQLTEKILWCVEHKNELKQMGIEARSVYNNIFSIDAFEQKFKCIIDEMML